MARPKNREMEAFLGQFVCLRVVQMHGVELERFRFDWDLTVAFVFMSPDGTVYGRYGSRGGKDAATHTSLEGFQAAARAALELHRAYPGNREDLAGKQAGPSPWKTPEAMPALAPRKFQRVDDGEKCLHCHIVREGELTSSRRAGRALSERDIWPYPLPDVLGLAFDREACATVLKVEKASGAEKAGFKPGDRVLRMGGQPIVSIADLQWVLHQASGDSLGAVVSRGGTEEALTLGLPAGWRARSDVSWRVSHNYAAMGIAGFRLEPIPAGARGALGLKKGEMGLQVDRVAPTWLVPSNRMGARLLKKGDAILAVDGKNPDWDEADFLAYLYLRKKPGESVDLTVGRGGRREEVTLPLN